MTRLAAGLLLLLPCAGLLVYSAWLGPPIFEDVRRLPTDEKLVALSFDDGPNPPFTDALLALLEREGIRASFFMTGQHVVAHPDAARRVVAAGHHVGNHSWNERRLARMSPGQAREALERTDAALREAGVSGPIDARAPGLSVGFAGAWTYRNTGRRHIGGTVTAADWTREPVAETPPCPWWLPADFCPTQDAQELARRVLASVGPSDIIVLHDGHDAFGGADRSGTVAAAAQVIRVLRERGYRFVAVQDFLKSTAPR